MKIASVDDEQDMRQSISKWLALSGFETETYAGAPAVATPERGEAILEELSRQAAEALD